MTVLFAAASTAELNTPGEWFLAILSIVLIDIVLAAQQAGVRGTFKLEQGSLTYTEQGSFSSEALCAHFEPAAELLRDLADAAEACARVR